MVTLGSVRSYPNPCLYHLFSVNLDCSLSYIFYQPLSSLYNRSWILSTFISGPSDFIPVWRLKHSGVVHFHLFLTTHSLLRADQFHFCEPSTLCRLRTSNSTQDRPFRGFEPFAFTQLDCPLSPKTVYFHLDRIKICYFFSVKSQ